MADSKLFLLTRFNLPLFPTDKNRRPTLTDQWYQIRFDLFEKYCLPSITNQTDKDFCWLCLFDSSTPDIHKEKIKSYQENYDIFTPVFFDEQQTSKLTESISREINSRIEDSVNYILTCNIDNDDSLHKDAVKFIKQASQSGQLPQQGGMISMLYGYQYFEKGGFALKMRYPGNHFLCLYEPRTEIMETVYFSSHTSATKKKTTYFIADKGCLWLEIVHGNNVSNSLRINSKIKNAPVFRSIVFSDYGLPQIKTCYAKQLFINIFIMPFAFAVTGIKRLATKGARKKGR